MHEQITVNQLNKLKIRNFIKSENLFEDRGRVSLFISLIFSHNKCSCGMVINSETITIQFNILLDDYYLFINVFQQYSFPSGVGQFLL